VNDYIITADIRRVAKNKMAMQKLHEFCKAEKRKIFALRKIIVQGETPKKFDRLAKYIYYMEISLNTSFLKN
jgi:hypothetical protein